MGQNTDQGQVTVEIVRKAIMGAVIGNSGELYASYGEIPQECVTAVRIVNDHYAGFESLVWQRLSDLPMIRHFFGRLIRKRLQQRGVLVSPIISAIFDDQQGLEERLRRIQSIPGASELRREYRGSNHPDLGHVTDENTVDFAAEVLVLDLLGGLGFSSIIKAERANSSAHVDIVAERYGKLYAVEVTRKREIRGWQTLPYGNLEDCDSSANQDRIRRVLLHTLASKENQFSRAMEAGTIDGAVIKVVAIKTSDYGFAECIGQAERIARELLAEEGNWEHIDCIWLVPNIAVKASRWLCKRHGDAVSPSEETQ